jgi:hypothetical protein
MEEHRLRLCEKKLRRIFGPEEEEVKGRLKKIT